MNLVDLLKKNIVMVPVVASVLVGTFTGVRYIVNLTDTINQNELRLTNLERDVGVLEKNITDINTRLSSAEATWQMAENLYRQLADQVREHSMILKILTGKLIIRMYYGDSQDELLFYRCINYFICCAVFYGTGLS